MNDQSSKPGNSFGASLPVAIGSLTPKIGLGSSFPANLGVTVKLGPVERPVGALRYIPLADFQARFHCTINTLPQNVCVVGWSQSERRWYVAPRNFSGMRATHASYLFHNRNNEKLLAFLVKAVVEPLRLPQLWFPYCFYDGWRERNMFATEYRFVDPGDLTNALEWHGAPGEIPMLCRDRHWLGCFGAHLGDPSAVLLPDLHYLVDGYRGMFDEVDAARTPWRGKKDRGVFAAGNHGEPRNLRIPTSDPSMHPRRLFAETVQRDNLDFDVFLGQRCSRSEQIAYRYIADVDGFARTWDAWAWKMMSGCTVLAVESIWESFFSTAFVPWQHYVPVANDCSDLGTKLAWCRANERECEAIADRARSHAEVVYSAAEVARRLRENFERRLQPSYAK